MVTAKKLDDLKKKIEAKANQIEGLQAELEELKAQFQADAQEFLGDISIEEVTTSPNRIKKVEAIITKMIGTQRNIEIKRPEKLSIAEEAGVDVADVEEVLKDSFQAYPLNKKGRKSKFGLKK